MSRIFVENQRFRAIWAYLVLIAVGGIFAWAIVQQIILGKPFGNQPAPDWVLLLLTLIPVGIFWMIRRTRLKTRIDKLGIHYKFSPFFNSWRSKKWTEIQKVEVVTYNPIRDYGGWGWRLGLKGKAYNVAGNRGLKIHLKNGKHFLIGTQKPDEMQDVLSQLEV